MMLKVSDVRKAYGDHHVLRGVDLDVDAGSIVGLVGANGAGKTTLISIVAGLVPPDGGHVWVEGADRRGSAPGSIGLAPQPLGVYPTLTVGENLMCFAYLLGVPRRQAKGRAQEVAEMVGLENRWDRRVEELSGGQQRRLHTGIAVLHRPRLLFLDEPTVGADVQSRARILQIVRDLAAEGAAIVYTTHYLTELEQLDADIALLNGGVIVERGSVDGIVRRWAHASVVLRFESPAPELRGWRVNGTTLVPIEPTPDPGATAAAALAALGPRACSLIGVDVTRPSLESAYMAITGHSLEPEATHDLAA